MLDVLFKISSNNLEQFVSFFNFDLLKFMSKLLLKVSLRISVGIIDTRLALPHLSPRPFKVPWICLAPAKTAASEFATAFPVSLWACIPRWSLGIILDISETISLISCGNVPPFVSQRIIHLAPLSYAAFKQDSA